MASKKKLGTADYNDDMELDYVDVDFGSEFDSALDSDVKKNKRSAVGSTFKGTISGAKSALLSPSTLSKVVTTALPKQYGEARDVADRVSSNVSTLYNDTVKEIKPVANKLAKEVDKLVPPSMKRTKSLVEKLKGMTSNEDYSGESKEQVRETGINSTLAGIFSAQAESDEAVKARDDARESIRDRIEDNRYKSNSTLTQGMAGDINRLAQYNDRINSAYQRKTLEIQLRSYYTHVDLLEETKRSTEIMKGQLETVVHNTALPEYIKIKESERYKEMAKRKFFGSVSKGLFGEHDHIENAFKKLRSIVKEKTAGVKDALESGLMGAEQMNMSREMNAEMGEDGSVSSQAGEMIGGAGINALAHKAGKKLREFVPESVHKFGHKLAANVRDMNGTMRKARDSEMLKGDYSGGFVDTMKSTARDVLTAGMEKAPDMKIGQDKGEVVGGLSGAGMGYDNASRTSVVTIIPGLLSRILKEVSKDSKAELTTYDHEKDEFVNESELVGRVKQRHTKLQEHDSYNSATEEIVNFISKGKTLPDNVKETLRLVINKVIKENKGLRASNLADPKNYKDIADKESVKATRALVRNRFNVTDEGTGNEEDDGSLIHLMDNLKGKVKDTRGYVDSLNSGGLGSIAKKAGILEEDSDGGLRVKDYTKTYAEDANKKAIKTDGPVKPDVTHAGYATSDHEAKEGITKTQPKSILDRIAKLTTSKWKYKGSKGKSSEEHIGPMAQDVNKELGEEAAPGGKKIDLITLNGMNMTAISQLRKEQEDLEKKQATPTGAAGGIVNAIKESTKEIVSKLDELKLSQGTSGSQEINKKLLSLLGSLSKRFSSMKFKKSEGKPEATEEESTESNGSIKENLYAYAKKKHESISGKIAGLVANAAALLMDVTGKVKDGLASGLGILKDKKDNVVKPGLAKAADFVKQYYKDHKDGVKKIMTNLWNQGTEMVTNVFGKVKEKTMDFFTNKLPAGFKTVKQALNTAKEFIYDKLDKPIDIYVAGASSPILRASIMAAGGYFDQISGKVIKRPSEIKGPVLDHEGNMVVSVEDFEKGLVDKDGEKLKSPLHKAVSMVIGTAKVGLAALLKAGKSILDRASPAGAGVLNSIKGFFSKISGSFGEAKTVKVLTQIRDMLNARLKGKKSDFSEKEEPSTGSSPTGSTGPISNPFANLKEKVSGSIKKAKDKVKDIFSDENKTHVKEKVDETVEKVKDSKVGKKAAELVEKAKETKAAGILNTVKDKYAGSKLAEGVGKAKEKGAGLLAGTKNKLSGIKGFFSKKEETEKKAKPKKYKLAEAKPESPFVKRAFNDKDGDGKRDGNVDEQFAKQKARHDAEAAKPKAEADLTARYKSKTNVLDLIADKAKGALSAVSDGLSGLFNLFGGGLGGLMKKIPGGGMLTKALGFGAKALGVVGSLGVGTIGTLASGAVSAAGMAGSAALTAGSLALSGIGAAVTGIASVLASPVVLGVAATALAGYALYKGAKYITRDDAKPIEQLRMLQYGLNEAHKDHYHHIYGLENALLEKAIGYNRGQAYLMERKLDMKSIYSDFGIAEEDQVMIDRFNKWFAKRFKPVFLTHLTALYAADPKAKLEDVSKLKDAVKLKYIKAAAYPEGPYDEDTSPFDDVDQLAIGVKGSIATKVDDLTKDSRAKVTKEGKEESARKEESTYSKVMSSLKVGVKAAWGGAKGAVTGAISGMKQGWKSGDGVMSSIKNAVTGAVTGSIAGAERGFSDPTAGSGGDFNDVPMPKSAGTWEALKNTIYKAASMTGVDPKMLGNITAIESGFRPTIKAPTSSATGLLQFLSKTWNAMLAKYGNKYNIPKDTPATDPRANALMGGEFIKENIGVMKSVLKRPTTDTDVYLAHFLGAPNAKKFLAASPNDIAANVLPDSAKSNREIFYKGNNALTIGEVYAVLDNKVKNTGTRYGVYDGQQQPEPEVKGVAVPEKAVASTSTVGPTTTAVTPTAGAAVAAAKAEVATPPKPVVTAGTSAAPTTKPAIIPATTLATPAAVSAAIVTASNPPVPGMANKPSATREPSGQDVQKAARQYTPILSPPPAMVGMSNSVASNQPNQKQSQDFSLGDVPATLTKSLDVQTQMASLLVKISSQLSPENLKAALSNISNGTKQETAQANTPAPSRNRDWRSKAVQAVNMAVPLTRSTN